MPLSNLKLNYISGMLLLIFLFYMVSCHKTPVVHESIFENEPTQKALDPQSIDEASGIADSRINRGYIWVQEDSGNPPQLFLVGHDAKVKKSIYLDGISNRDWEDMTIAKGPDPSLDYLYVADIGDNGAAHSEYTIDRFPEPSLTVDTVRKIDRIVFKYPDGPHDAEAFVVDDLNKEIYIITKRDTASRIYRMKSPINQNAVNTLEYVTSLKFTGVVSADIATDRKSMLVKTYSAIYYFDIKQGLSLSDAFNSTPAPVTYQVEPQGEAICFMDDNSGFFTLSEKAFASTVKLYYYKRK
jgi:hypothetical protein